MPIYGFTGKTGSGKSLKMLEMGIDFAQERRKMIVSNFNINLVALHKYAVVKKYGWIAKLIEQGQIVVIDANASIVELISYKGSVALVDEAQIWISASHYREIPRELLMNLQQSRKLSCDVFWTAQVDAHVALQWRQQTHYFIHADGIQKYDKQMRNQKLVFKTYYYFDAENYWGWVEDGKARRSYFRTRFNYAFSTTHGLINKNTRMLFDCYDSFTRLELQKELSKAADSMHYCILPDDYYFSRCEALKIPYSEFVLKDPARGQRIGMKKYKRSLLQMLLLPTDAELKKKRQPLFDATTTSRKPPVGFNRKNIFLFWIIVYILIVLVSLCT